MNERLLKAVPKLATLLIDQMKISFAAGNNLTPAARYHVGLGLMLRGGLGGLAPPEPRGEPALRAK